MPEITIKHDANERVISIGSDAVEASRQRTIAEAKAEAAAESAAFAEEFSGPAYSSQAEGEAATSEGQFFRVWNGDTPRTYTRYERTAAGSAFAAPLATTTALAAGNEILVDGGAVEHDGALEYAPGTSGYRINILSATMRPAMRGIFSDAPELLIDRKAELMAFINEAAEGGKTIEWWNREGPLDVSLDVATGGTERGLMPPPGSRWVGHPETRFRAIPNDAGNYEILNLRNTNDFVFEANGARVVGERDSHTGMTGEWGHGMAIKGSSRIRISHLIAEGCWGDGFWIGDGGAVLYSQDIELDHCEAINCRRNGVSVISVRGLCCADISTLDNGGTSPDCGWDFEPNSPTHYLEDVDIIRPRTGGNLGPGLKIFLNSMDGSTNPVSIRIEGHSDDGSAQAVALGFAGAGIPGLIRFIGPASLNALGPGISARNYQETGPKVVFDDPVFIDWNRAGNGSTSPKYGSAVAIYAEASDAGPGAMGNIEINRPRYTLNSGAAPRAFAVLDERANAKKADALEHNDPREIPAGLSYWTNSAANLKLRDRDQVSTIHLSDASQTIAPTGFASRYIFPANSSSRAYTIGAGHSIGTELEFVVGAIGSGRSRVTFGANVSLLTENVVGTGFYIFSDSKGAILRIRREWSTLAYDAQTSNFTVGEILTGGSSGATGTIRQITDSGTTGTLSLDSITGAFQDNETITSASGSAVANGVLRAEWSVLGKTGVWTAV